MHVCQGAPKHPCYTTQTLMPGKGENSAAREREVERAVLGQGVRPLTPRLHGALVQSGGAMKVVNSGDVFMNGANFSECTASYVRPPTHARKPSRPGGGDRPLAC